MIRPKLLLLFVIIIAVVVVGIAIPNNPIKVVFERFIPPGEPTVNVSPEEGAKEIPQQITRLNGMLSILDIEEGVGTAIEQGSTVSLEYQGSLADGKEFDRTPDGQTFDITVGETSLIEGFTEGLIGLREGGVRILLIKSPVGYGEQGVVEPDGTVIIPPDADLMFQVHAVSVR